MSKVFYKLKQFDDLMLIKKIILGKQILIKKKYDALFNKGGLNG